MVTDSTHTELLSEERPSAGRKLIAAACALLVTAGVFAGYTYLRKRHTLQMARSTQSQRPSTTLPKGPPKAHIVVDDALLKAGHTLIGGTVKNTSEEKLTQLAVGLELKRRKDGSIDQMQVPIEPPDLQPSQEGRYALKLPSQQYLSVRLVSLKSGSDSTQLAYTTSQGQKRQPERLEPKVVVVPRAGSRGGGFLNSPDNPARVP